MRPDPASVYVMRQIDELSAELRALVYEYGLVLVIAIAEENGTQSPKVLRRRLEQIRTIRQEQWLLTDYVSERSMESIVQAAMRRHAY